MQGRRVVCSYLCLYGIRTFSIRPESPEKKNRTWKRSQVKASTRDLDLKIPRIWHYMFSIQRDNVRLGFVYRTRRSVWYRDGESRASAMILSPQEQGMDFAKQSRLIHTGRKENPAGRLIGLVWFSVPTIQSSVMHTCIRFLSSRLEKASRKSTYIHVEDIVFVFMVAYAVTTTRLSSGNGMRR